MMNMKQKKELQLGEKQMQFKYDDGGRSDDFKGTTDDCVIRAIAIATGNPYKEVYNTLFQRTKDFAEKKKCKLAKKIKAKNLQSPRKGVFKKIYDAYLKEKGWVWVPTMQIGSGCTHHLKENELPSGTIICRLSKHLVTVIDGVIHDTYDPSRGGKRCVYGYYMKSK